MNQKTSVIIVHDNNIHDKSFVELVQRCHDIKLVSVAALSMEDFSQSLLIIVQINLADPKSLKP